MDLTFKTQQGRFNYRVGAIIIQEGKVLMVKNSDAPYYYSVGGRVKMGESCEEAMLREIEEELGVSAKIERPVFFNESFFTEEFCGEKFHEVAIYFSVKLPENCGPLTCQSVTENGSTESLHWLEIEKLHEVEAYPLFFAEELLNLPESMKYLVERQ